MIRLHLAIVSILLQGHQFAFPFTVNLYCRLFSAPIAVRIAVWALQKNAKSRRTKFDQNTENFLISSEIRNFSIYFSAKSLLQNLTFALTNTLTNTAKVPHRTGQHRAGFPARRCFFTRFWNHYSESKKLTLYCDRVTDGYRCKDRGSRFNRNRKKEQDEALLFTFRGSGPP